jgi:MoaA/NifB/PqqE/SkfB family radical SAM enzyme
MLKGVIMLLSDRCNGRCVMCDYWRVPAPRSLTPDEVIAFWTDHVATVPDFATLSGGEPLLYPNLPQLAAFLRPRVRSLVLSTNGLLLADQAEPIAAAFDKVIISVDGARAATLRAIRGRDVLESILRATTQLRQQPKPPRIVFKMTIQKRNFRELDEFLRLAHDCGVSNVALAVPDLCSTGFVKYRTEARHAQIMLTPAETAEFQARIPELLARSDLLPPGFLIEGSLPRFGAYFAYHCGQPTQLPERTCNVGRTRLILASDGAVRPCFFLDPIGRLGELPAGDYYSSAPAVAFRQQFDSRRNPVCRECAQFLDWSF